MEVIGFPAGSLKNESGSQREICSRVLILRTLVVQLTLGQYGFELHRSTNNQIKSIPSTLLHDP